MGVCRVGVYLMGVYLIGMCLMGVYLVGMHLTGRAPHWVSPWARGYVLETFKFSI
jgi:hypothetical protein